MVNCVTKTVDWLCKPWVSTVWIAASSSRYTQCGRLPDAGVLHRSKCFEGLAGVRGIVASPRHGVSLTQRLHFEFPIDISQEPDSLLSRMQKLADSSFGERNLMDEQALRI